MKKPSESATKVDTQLVNKAVGALLKHHTGQHADKADSLLGNDSVISVHFGLEQVPANASPKPKPITIPHSIYKTGDDDDMDDLEEPSVCLIVKEDSKEWIQEMIAQFPKEMGLVKKVLGLDSLRSKHAKFSQQRELLSRFDVFLADDRILPMLAKSIGKHFFTAKKQPLPICVTRRTSLPSNILKSLRSTHWYLSQGTCLAVKVGTTAMPAKHLMENIAAVCAHVPTKIPRKWANIRSIAIKTTHSTSLPIYNKTPEELKAIAEMAGLEVREPTKKVETGPTKEELAKEAAAAEAAKKKRKAKSPLIKALKKQQEEKTPESKLKKQRIASDSSSKKKKKRKEPEEEAAEEVVTKSPEKKRKMSMDKSSSTPKASSAKKTRSAAKEETPKMSTKKAKLETPKSSAKKAKETTPKSSAKKAKEATPKSSAKKAKEATPKSSAKKASKEETPKSSAKKVAAPASADSKSADYIATRKFKGSKKGYAFKMGTKGLGYYVDVKPKVDPMAIAALARLGAGNRNKGGGSNSGKKPKRRGRR